MQFIDLKKQQDRIRPQLDAAISRVLDHGQYILGPEVRELEKQLSEFTGSRHCLGVSNGTDALLAALMALDVGPGDAVLTSPFTFFATVETIVQMGATPVFVDVCPNTYNICPNKLREILERHTAGGPERGLDEHKQPTEGCEHCSPAAGPGTPCPDSTSNLEPQTSNPIDKLHLVGAVLVDIFGQPCNYDAILPLLAEHGLWMIQDSAQSFGATFKDKVCPSMGLIGCTSFFPAKPLGGYGDGGAVFTDDDELMKKLTSIRVHGMGSDKYDNVRIGLNARLDSIQAAILLEKLKLYPEEIDLRNQVASWYREELELQQPEGLIRVPRVIDDAVSVWAQYVVEIENRDAVQAKLREAGIPSALYYGIPMHLLKALESFGFESGLCPVAESIANTVVALPFHPYLSRKDVRTVVSAL